MFKAFAIAATMIVSSASASFAATLIYDGTIHNSSTTTRGVGSAPLGQFTVASTTEVTQFSQVVDLNGTSDLKFVVFENSSLIFNSGLIAGVADLGFQDILSPVFSLFLTAGNTYYFGLSSSTGGQYRYGFNPGTQSGISTSNSNGNVGNFANPAYSGSGGVPINVSLYSDPVAPVPVPAGLPLVITGLAVFGLMRSHSKAA